MIFWRCKECGNSDLVKDRLCELCLFDRDVEVFLDRSLNA